MWLIAINRLTALIYTDTYFSQPLVTFCSAVHVCMNLNSTNIAKYITVQLNWLCYFYFWPWLYSHSIRTELWGCFPPHSQINFYIVNSVSHEESRVERAHIKKLPLVRCLCLTFLSEPFKTPRCISSSCLLSQNIFLKPHVSPCPFPVSDLTHV